MGSGSRFVHRWSRHAPKRKRVQGRAQLTMCRGLAPARCFIHLSNALGRYEVEGGSGTRPRLVAAVLRWRRRC